MSSMEGSEAVQQRPAVKGLDSIQFDRGPLFTSLDGTTTVFKGRERFSLLYVAVKRVTKEAEDERVVSDVVHEVRIMSKLKHDRVVAHLAWYQTPRHLWVVSELCPGGSLREVLVHNPLETEAVKHLAKDIAAGLLYLHGNEGIVHGDVRPENIMLTANGVAKLAGFAMARYNNNDDDETDLRHRRVRDHLLQFAEYTAPEILKTCSTSPEAQVRTTFASDFWTVGITLFESIIGSTPFTGTSFFHLSERILHDEPYYFREGSSKEFSIAPFLKLLLEKNPCKRLVGEELDRAVTAL